SGRRFVTSDGEQLQSFAVNAHLDLDDLGCRICSRPPEPADWHRDLDAILAIYRKIVMNHRPAAGAKRQLAQPIALIQLGGYPIELTASPNRGITDNLTADLLGRGQVVLEQR